MEHIEYLELIVHKVRRDHPQMALRSIHDKIVDCRIGRDRFEHEFKRRGYGITRVVKPTRTTDSRGVSKFDNLAKDIELNHVNQVWVSDITYFELDGKFYYLTFIMDVYSRRIVGHAVSDRLLTRCTTLPALQAALKLRGFTPLNQPENLIIHSDGGGQYYSDEFQSLTKAHGLRNSMAENVYENPHAERINGIIKNNYLKHWTIQSLEQLVKSVDRAVSLYNHQKPHKALRKSTPVDFENGLIYFAEQQKSEGDKLIDGKLKKKGASSPISSWQQKSSGSKSISGKPILIRKQTVNAI